jgi:hypothetical protein
VYAKFSPSKKAKHLQLRNPGKESGVGSTGSKKNAANVSEFSAAVSSAVAVISALTYPATKCTATKEATAEDDPDPWLNTNHKNPALACQSKKTKGNN